MSDVPVSRMAFGILLRAVNSWGSQGENAGGIASVANGSRSGSVSPDFSIKLEAPGFYQFMYEHILRITFEVPMKPTFDLQDGQSVLVLGEIAGLQKAMAQKQGDVFLRYLSQVYLPSMNCPPDLVQEFVQALQQLEAKQYKKYFQVTHPPLLSRCARSLQFRMVTDGSFCVLSHLELCSKVTIITRFTPARRILTSYPTSHIPHHITHHTPHCHPQSNPSR